jgi:tetratricopeptide (TPR) repeat protein
VHITETPEQPPDFFISRAGADAAFAAEIGRILEADGKTVVLQQWDFANRNFMERMHRALESGARVIALLSNDYLASDHCEAEWQNAIAHDPLNRNGRLIVLRVAESTPTGLLTALAYWDLVPVRSDRNLVRDIVLAAVRPRRHNDVGALGQYWRAPRPVVHPEIRPTSTFTGREAELASIHALLWSGEAAAITQPVAAHGLGGIGKSALAREYAHRHRSDYAGVWWLNAAKPADGTVSFEGVERALVELGAVFIRGLELVEDRAQAARQALDFIAHGGFEKPWLLVYDNVDDVRVLREWPPAGNAHVLLTTRISGWPAAIRTVEVEEWSLPEAIRYIHEESGRLDLTDADAGRVAEVLGCLPLALSHAAAYLRARPNVMLATYVEGLTRRMSETPKDAEYPRAVFATFQEALAQAQREASGAVAVMSLAAFFAPDNIPEELFQQPAECYPSGLAELVVTPGAVDEAIGALAHLSLVDFSRERRTFSAHRLVLATARDALGDSAAAWSNSALRTLASAFPDPADSRTWPVCERFIAHVRAVETQTSEDSPALARLLGTTGVYLEERAALAEVLALWNRAREIFARLVAADPGNDLWQRDLSVAHNKIGDVLRAQGSLALTLDSYRAALAISERLASADPDDAGWQRDLSVAHEKIGDVQSVQGNLARALHSYSTCLAIRERLEAKDPGNSHWQRDLAVAHNKIGDVQSAQGDLSLALHSYGASLAISERLAAADPGNAGWQRDLSVSQERIGDVQSDLGNLDLALHSYSAALAIRERLAAADPGNTGWQYDLGIGNERIGNILLAQGKLAAALSAYERRRQIVAELVERDPGNAHWQRDLSVSHLQIGDIHSAQGDLGAALDSYSTCLAIRERLAAKDPGNAQWQRDLSAAHLQVGDALRAQGNLALALDSYRAALAIRERLAAQDPGNAQWQRSLSVSHSKVGDMLRARGDLGAALDRYSTSLAIFERLAAADPGNAGWQRDLSVSQERIGDVLRDHGDVALALDSYSTCLAIRERLAAADPGNVHCQRDVSVSQEKIGDVLRAQGDLAAALHSYRASFTIRERLAAAIPGNSLWQRDLSISRTKIGDVQSEQGNLALALHSYRAALAIREHLAAAHPGSTQSQHDLLTSYVNVAEVAQRDQHTAGEARQHYEEALAIARDLHARNRLAPRDAWTVAELEARLARLALPTTD